MHPLGKWKNRSHQTWDGYVNASREIMVIKNYQYRRNPLTAKYEVEETSNKEYCCEFPADIDYETNTILSSRRKEKNKQGDEGETNVLKKLPYWERRNIGTVLPDTTMLEQITDLLVKKKFLAVSDGSYKNGEASHSWCIADKETKQKYA